MLLYFVYTSEYDLKIVHVFLQRVIESLNTHGSINLAQNPHPTWVPCACLCFPLFS